MELVLLMVSGRHSIERRFGFDRDLLWRVWVESELFGRWYGPNMETLVHRYDVCPGGRCLIEMRSNNRSVYQRFDILQAGIGERLEFLLSTTDAQWQVVSMSNMPHWPGVFLVVVELSNCADGGVMMRLTTEPHGASPEEIACFDENVASMDSGWQAGFDLIEELVSSF